MIISNYIVTGSKTAVDILGKGCPGKNTNL
jgi:hypothetical protein